MLSSNQSILQNVTVFASEHILEEGHSTIELS